jgi:hypothetical protein
MLIGNAASKVRVVNNFVRGLDLPSEETLPIQKPEATIE